MIKGEPKGRSVERHKYQTGRRRAGKGADHAGRQTTIHIKRKHMGRTDIGTIKQSIHEDHCEDKSKKERGVRMKKKKAKKS